MSALLQHMVAPGKDLIYIADSSRSNDIKSFLAVFYPSSHCFGILDP